MDVRTIDGALIFTSGMNIDADGAPNAYNPAGGGLDYLANAGADGNWYGVVTDTGDKTGTPIKQGPHDPYPGCFISPTALSDHTKKSSDPTKYVDSTQVAYISIPRDLKEQGAKLGDLCACFYKGMMWCGIVADIGPRGKYGEASIKMAQHLSIPCSPKNGGTSAGVTYLILKDTGKGWPRPNCEQEAQDAFDAWGGLEKLRTLAILK